MPPLPSRWPWGLSVSGVGEQVWGWKGRGLRGEFLYACNCTKSQKFYVWCKLAICFIYVRRGLLGKLMTMSDATYLSYVQSISTPIEDPLMTLLNECKVIRCKNLIISNIIEAPTSHEGFTIRPLVPTTLKTSPDTTWRTKPIPFRSREDTIRRLIHWWQKKLEDLIDDYYLRWWPFPTLYDDQVYLTMGIS